MGMHFNQTGRHTTMSKKEERKRLIKEELLKRTQESQLNTETAKKEAILEYKNLLLTFLRLEKEKYEKNLASNKKDILTRGKIDMLVNLISHISSGTCEKEIFGEFIQEDLTKFPSYNINKWITEQEFSKGLYHQLHSDGRVILGGSTGRSNRTATAVPNTAFVNMADRAEAPAEEVREVTTAYNF